MKGVYGLWLCPSSPASRAGTVHSLKLTASVSPKGGRLPPERMMDKMRLTLVHGNGDTGRNAKGVHGFLWALTAQGIEMSERARILTEVYGMTMTNMMKESIKDSEELWLNFYGRKRWKEDLKASEKRGMLKGREEGKEEIVVMMLKQKCSLEFIEKITQMSWVKILQIAQKNFLPVDEK